MTWQDTIAAAAAAAPGYAATDPGERARFLVAAAEELEACAPELVGLGMAETGLGEARLTGELRRTAYQLRLFAEVVVEGAYLDVRIDEADPGFAIGPRPDLRRMNVPVGPVLVYAASNFPLAFSVAGGDTAAALAAGCPVVVKGHSGHPGLSARTAEALVTAARRTGMPDGVIGLITGQQAGIEALQDERIKAASFTGSTRIGAMLARTAAERPSPIQFYGELGSVNPVVVTPAAVAERGAAILEGFVTSVAGSAGQLCTKPGFLFVPDAASTDDVIRAAADVVPEHRLLTRGTSAGYVDRRGAVLAAGAHVIADGGVRTDEDGFVWARPTLVETTLSELVAAGPDVLDEVFGPFSVLVRYDSLADVTSALPVLFPGNLTASIHLAESETPTVAPLIEAMSRIAGRVLVNGWPTGVSVSPAMQHGGPSPATTIDSTSVGTAAIGRFLRGVCYQSVPASLLPPAVRDDNPWGVPQRRSPAGASTSWGELTGRY
ncbi:aldehyde dehydrogenase (NADP(+)) [Brooklawnia cerclae]|uniref:NADP-dependent aldehyde dehydrogenase n=1 Tax=Brooklawnia cerclae TaxID=349934 RepID=A0ABX0SQ24_9ACTN|nr:aldehyde dehydrogenase (NADP(+)) [Brooklawnia cerclae]NIH58836.1 NADP-dependent aldehyde dehydrogenase [Brooklawnia cerclae]